MKARLIMAALACLLSIGTQAQKSSNHNFEVAKNLDIFNNIYRNLELMYVDTLNPAEVIGCGIDAMLSSLDPYTEYYPEEKDGELKMMLTGKYAGIGAIIRYHQREKVVVIDEPYEGMPAAEAGLRKGDAILAIDDSSMVGKSVAYVSERLRGQAGTSFVLRARRPSTGEEMQVKITRRSIKMPEIPYYGMRPGGIGYISLTSFTEGCAKDMRRAFIDLKKQGAEKLVLDLRSNGGGSLSEAIDIINMWVPKGVTLVETKGKLRQANRTYTTRMEPIDTLMPIVVMVNDETASASEILSGSLQDLDRGVVLGTRTYGKGLVQVPIDLPYNSTLKLTTSKYYIPSGRCIQAFNYKHGSGGYTEHIPDSLTHLFHTRNGREVRDGGGIKPDVEVRPDTLPNIAIYLDRMDSTEVMFDFVVDYIARHDTIAAPAIFSLTDDDFAEFKRRVVESGFTYDPMSMKRFDELVKMAKFEGYYDDARAEFDSLRAKLNHDVERDLERTKNTIMGLLKHDIVSAYYYQRGAIETSLDHDSQLRRAEELLSDSDAYAALLAAPTGEPAEDMALASKGK